MGSLVKLQKFVASFETTTRGAQNTVVETNPELLDISKNAPPVDESYDLPAGDGTFTLDHSASGWDITHCVVRGEFTRLDLEAGGTLLLRFDQTCRRLIAQDTIDLVKFLRHMPCFEKSHHHFTIKYRSSHPLSVKLKRRLLCHPGVSETVVLWEFSQIRPPYEYQVVDVSNNNTFTVPLRLNHQCQKLVLACEAEDGRLSNDVLQSVSLSVNHYSYTVRASEIDTDLSMSPVCFNNCYVLAIDKKINYSRVDEASLVIVFNDNTKGKWKVAPIDISTNFMVCASGFLGTRFAN